MLAKQERGVSRPPFHRGGQAGSLSPQASSSVEAPKKVAAREEGVCFLSLGAGIYRQIDRPT
eukprot:4072312-Amphidinium_carterae.1